MEKDEHDTIEDIRCRICAEYITDDNGTIHIFGDDARKNYLWMKIRRYLYVLVSVDDPLPKMVCFTCVKQLEGIHSFAMTAHRAQERLKIQFYRPSDVATTNEYEDHDTMGNHQRLLRSMLVVKAGCDMESTLASASLDLPILSSTPEDNGVTLNIMEEMEVKVDPMVFLQCDLDRSQSPGTLDSDSDRYEGNNYETRNSSNPVQENRANKIHYNSLKDKFIQHYHSADEFTNAESFDCDICARSFRSQAILQNHLWLHLSCTEHRDSERIDNSASNNNYGSFICPICNKKISTKGNLKVHLETHRPKGKYGCDICGRIFKTQANLFRHKEYHSGIQFPCSVCGRVYPTNSTLRAHSITHSNLRPHACPLCDKTFKRNQDLKFHINQHTGARPYQCPYCPKAFASSGNCFSHRKRMHPNEVHRDRQRAVDLMI